jgi:ABC-2 type transport system permease protein
MAVLFEMLKLLAIDLVFMAILSLIVVLLAVTKKAAFAVLKRNFVGYFSNPTGYIFLCLFVMLTSVAAFWPHEFFIANLANLDQLNRYIAPILLVFIPAISMGIWAEERRQGTDELLLTLPAGDFDIVIGKYLAAASIFTVSLLLSQLWNYQMLVRMALDPASGQVDLDTGLFFTTYLGYWLMGLAMLSIGMVGSFLTNNLTVSFILSLLFNLIPVAMFYADLAVPTSGVAQRISDWSFSGQFDDFGRGVISLSSMAFFLFLIALGIYLSLVLIGKRHWVRHDASDQNVLEAVLGIFGVIFGVVGLTLLVASVILTGDAGLFSMLIGLVFTALGAGLYVVAGNIATPKNTGSMWVHYSFRALALLAMAFGLVSVISRFDYRIDATEGQVSSLSPDTRKLLRELTRKTEQETQLEKELATLEKDSTRRKNIERQIADLKARRTRPIFIDAYISANVPEEFVKLRYELVSMLKELKSLAGSRVQLRMHDNLEPFSEEAAQAEERFGIRRQTFISRARGSLKEEEYIMGAAFTSGLEKTVVPTFSLGTPVEYELVRSIATVGRGEKRRLGVVRTDAQLMGGFSFAGGQPRQIPKQPIVDELEKQYKIEEVDPTSPIDTTKYDALLVAQPSSLGPLELSNVVEAIKNGQPAVIFEDPAPMVMSQAVGTAAPKPPMGGMMGMGGQPQPKGDIEALWSALGIQVTPGENTVRGQVPAVLVWQNFNPYPKLRNLPGLSAELMFIRNDAPGGKGSFAPDQPVVAGFEELLVPYATGVSQSIGGATSFTELVTTSPDISGTIELSAWEMAQVDPLQLAQERKKSNDKGFVLAAWVRGNESDAPNDADKGEEKAEGEADSAAAGDDPSSDGPKPVNAIYVTDVDMLHATFMQWRNQPDEENNFRFDNVSFVLNLVDAVVGDERFLEIRKRKPRHSTLRTIEAQASEARDREVVESDRFQKKYKADEDKAEAERKKNVAAFQKIADDLRQKREAGEEVDPNVLFRAIEEVTLKEEVEKRRADVQKERLRIERDKELARIRRERDREVQSIQNQQKVISVLILPVPLIIGGIVWTLRRLREREGVSRSRMKLS